jgi:hypothetical protein
LVLWAQLVQQEQQAQLPDQLVRQVQLELPVQLVLLDQQAQPV